MPTEKCFFIIIIDNSKKAYVYLVSPILPHQESNHKEDRKIFVK